ncbi:hypothetical protein [Actinomyces sp. MRS3W]|nr:hypothetical protein [Actinomyces sp. MRS3W]MDU0348224.1 hypothetical protein [Actinomyces sp. MRS3W]
MEDGRVIAREADRRIITPELRVRRAVIQDPSGLGTDALGTDA